MKLNVYVRENYGISRKEADRLIGAGKITVNGEVKMPAYKVQDTDDVQLAKAVLPERIYLAYNKPRGLTTQTSGDEDTVVKRFKNWKPGPARRAESGISPRESNEAHPSAVKRDSHRKMPESAASIDGASSRNARQVDATTGSGGLFPVGRLDKESEGLLIVTNDGRLSTWLLDPNKDHDKTYIVKTQEHIRAGVVDIMAGGMVTKKYGKLKPVQAKILGDKKVQMTLTEGKNHQIRIMLSELGLTVTDLKRVRIMNIDLGNLKPGATRPITATELDTLISALQ